MVWRIRARAARVVVGVLASALALGLVACGDNGSSSSSSGSTGGGGQKHVNVAFLAQSLANTYNTSTAKGIEDEAARSGASVKVFDAQLKAERQFSQCQDAIASQQYQALVVLAVDATIKPCLESAIKAGIKVVTTDFPVGQDYTTTEPQIPGQSGAVFDPAATRGRWILDLIDQACADTRPCEVVFLAGVLADPYNKAIIDVIKQGVAGSSDIKLDAVEQAFYDKNLGYRVTQDLLQAHPGLDVIASASDPMTVGAEQAVKQRGLEGKVKLLGGGASSESFKAIPAGRWFGTYVTLPYDEGMYSARVAIGAARGNDKPQGISPIEKRGVPPVVTQRNFAQVKAKLPKAQW
ncbi:MAG: sugar ABC transporter substrate-binding protein [Actinobacteria bacterium]|nr:sugar ABC transporter substrate-binding protein [Actinomycetota bacterium]